jgi:hypothetical protein
MSLAVAYSSGGLKGIFHLALVQECSDIFDSVELDRAFGCSIGALLAMAQAKQGGVDALQEFVDSHETLMGPTGMAACCGGCCAGPKARAALAKLVFWQVTGKLSRHGLIGHRSNFYALIDRVAMLVPVWVAGGTTAVKVAMAVTEHRAGGFGDVRHSTGELTWVDTQKCLSPDPISRKDWFHNSDAKKKYTDLLVHCVRSSTALFPLFSATRGTAGAIMIDGGMCNPIPECAVEYLMSGRAGSTKYMFISNCTPWPVEGVEGEFVHQSVVQYRDLEGRLETVSSSASDNDDDQSEATGVLPLHFVEHQYAAMYVSHMSQIRRALNLHAWIDGAFGVQWVPDRPPKVWYVDDATVVCFEQQTALGRRETSASAIFVAPALMQYQRSSVRFGQVSTFQMDKVAGIADDCTQMALAQCASVRRIQESMNRAGAWHGGPSAYL